MIFTDGLHLVATKTEELHSFAEKIGLQRRWFQNHPTHPHYDLTSHRKIQQAIEMGAKLIDKRDLVRELKKQRSIENPIPNKINPFDRHKDFAYWIREILGLSVEWIGTKQVRLRAWPRGTHWQGWYASGKTKEEAYKNLVYLICKIPAFWHLHRAAPEIIQEAEKRAKKETKVPIYPLIVPEDLGIDPRAT